MMNRLNYIGCKYSLFDTLLPIFENTITDLASKTFSDPFMGTGIVAFMMQKKCKKVIANDIEQYSFVIGNAVLCCNYSDRLATFIKECNELEEVEGLIYKHYSPHETCGRMFFTNENARKADAIRMYIQQMLTDKIITQSEYYFLLASLLTSIDKVANTSAVYGAYLKEYKTSAKKKMILTPIHTDRHLNKENEMINGLAEDICGDQKADITYLDPPYNQRSYNSNYFVLNFIVLYDETIEPKGITGLFDSPTNHKSDFCSKVKIAKVFQTLIDRISSRYIVLSYNNEGLLSFDQLRGILLKKGDTTLHKIVYAKFKAQKNVDKKFVCEYVWVVDTHSKTNRFTEIA